MPTQPDVSTATEKFEVRNRWTGAIQFTADIPIGLGWRLKIGAAVKWAFGRDAVLRGADLRDAVLRDAVLCDAVLRGADLRGADLRGAVLCGAVLCGADLRDADLRGADLRGADLRSAVLCGADLRNAVLCGADLRDAVLRGAVLSGAVLRGAVLSGVPVVPEIDKAILAAVEGGDRLDMTTWHCGTSHCRAGWAIALAGEAGSELERRVGPEAAGTLIYLASRPDKPVPDFFASNEDALASIRADAAEGV